MSNIATVHAREILDSRGNPTVEVDLMLDNGQRTRAGVPSGASTGKREAAELRDGDRKRYQGLGVLKAVENVNGEIARVLRGMNPLEQERIDRALIELDGTANKGRLGANAILGASLAVLKAGAELSGVPLYEYIRDKYRPGERYVLPLPMLNILNGGVHAENSSDFQEYKIVAVGAPNFREALRWSSEVFHALKDILHNLHLPTTVGDEGGFAPPLAANQEYVELILQAIERAGYRPGRDIGLALDPATNSCYRDGVYHLARDGRTLTSAEMIAFWEEWADRYPILSIEDGLAEDDWDNWKTLRKRLGGRVQIMGDDIFVTNPTTLKKAIRDGLANSSLIKPNQIGTVTETVEAVDLVRAAGWTAVFSHRSGETEDTTIADMAVGLSTGMIKTGSASRGERLAKYNRLLRIEEELGANAHYPGRAAFSSLG